MRMDRLITERVASSAPLHSLQISDEKTDEKLNMHYYQFNIKSYQSATLHLSNEEDLAYRRLMDFYYDSEELISIKPNKPTALQMLSRRLRVGITALESVLDEFFVLDENGWKHTYCDQVIADYKAYQEKQRANGSKGGRGNKADAKPNKPTALPPLTQAKPNAKPTINNKQETINHSIGDSDESPNPIPTKQSKEKATRISEGLTLSEEWRSFCKSERPDLDPQKTFERFKDYWISKPKDNTKLNWLATWRNWVRNQDQEKGFSAKSNASNIFEARHAGR